MEHYFTIPTPDWFEIQWVLNWKNKSEKLIIFCHGFQGKLNRHIFHNAAQYFPEKWYHSFRFNFYDAWAKNRKLHHCDFDIHGQDIDTVVEYFNSDYREIIVIGHSFGGLSILYSSQKFSQMVLWDPSLILKKNQSWIWESIYDEKQKLFLFPDDMTFISEKMLYQHTQESKKIAYNFLIPWYIICAEKCYLYENWSSISDEIEHCKWVHNILWANHNFDEEWKEEELFEKTLEFIKN